jgi:hypothetical protein
MADKTLFGRLKKLFSTQVVVRRSGNNNIKVVDSSKMQSVGNRNSSAYYDRYGRLHGSKKNWQTYNERFNYHANKLELYSDYESMDKDSIIASVLDIYSDESTLYDSNGDVLAITSSDEKIKKLLHNLFYDVLNIEFNLWSWVRTMNKYGDCYLHLDINDEYGVVNVEPLSSYDTIREEGYDPDNPYSVRFKVEGQGEKFYESFQIAHFRLLTDSNFLPYGRSLVEPARNVWKQLTLMEDAMLIHRIMRAPEKRVFKIDVGNIPPNEIDQHMENVINKMKKTPYINPKTGDYNLKFNLQNMLEDYYLAVRGGQSGTEIDTLSGMEFGGIDDIEYLRNRMLASLKVPKAFIGYEEGVEGKSTLAQQDIRFARTIERIQKIVVSELTKIAIVHLYSQGYEDDDLVNFSLSLNTPSIVYEQEKIELLTQQVGLIRDLKELKLVSHEYMYEHILNMSEDQWKKEQLKVINNLKLEFRQAQIEAEGNDPSVTGESFGTPHDLASVNQPSEAADELPEGGSRPGGNDGAGRPKETGKRGTDDASMGRDPLGKKTDTKPESAYNKPRKSPLSTERVESITKNMIKPNKVKTREIIMESLKITESMDTYKKNSLLDEDNIMDI